MMQQEEFDRRQAELDERELRLAKREKVLDAKGVRHCIYDRIDVPVGTIDTIIVLCAIAIVTLVIVGAYIGKG